MLIGEYSHSVDDKGRINIPSKFRNDLGENFIITKGLDNCLFVYPFAEWKVLEERIKELPLSQSRDLQRFFFSGACEAEIDKQGRVVIPLNLREYAGISRDVVISGASFRAEIWNKENYEKQSLALTSDRIIEAMDKIGF